MNDRNLYARWLRAYNAIDARYCRGELDPDDMDRLIADMEERLGVNTWTVERWAAAAERWQVMGEGA